MKKRGIIGMAAAFMGLAMAADNAKQANEDFGKGFSDQPKKRFLPSYGMSPKQYGMTVATSQSNIIKRKMRSKLAFG